VPPRARDVTPRQLAALNACLRADCTKQAAAAFGVSYDRLRHILSALYRDLGVRTQAQAVARLDDTMPGWRVRAA
jgi:hypothetical protein